MVSSCENGVTDAIEGDPELTVTLDAGCGRTVQLYVDGNFWGTLNPGDDETREVSAGTHTIRADPGWNFSVWVSDDKNLRQTLSCN